MHQQDEQLRAAFLDFSDALTDLQRVAEDLAASPDSAEKARIGSRVAAGLDAADQSKLALAQLGAVAKHLRRGDVIRMPSAAKIMAVRALKGGTVALSALCYEGRHYLAKRDNPALAATMPGMLVGTAFATLGGLLEIFGE